MLGSSLLQLLQDSPYSLQPMHVKIIPSHGINFKNFPQQRDQFQEFPPAKGSISRIFPSKGINFRNFPHQQRDQFLKKFPAKGSIQHLCPDKISIQRIIHRNMKKSVNISINVINSGFIASHVIISEINYSI